MAEGVNYYDGSSWAEVATVEDDTATEREVYRYDGSSWVQIYPSSDVIEDFEDGDTSFSDGEWSGWTGDTGSLSAQTGTVLKDTTSGELSSSNESVTVTASRSSVATPTEVSVHVQISKTTGNSSEDVLEIRTSTADLTIRFKGDGDLTSRRPSGEVDLGSDWSDGTQYKVRFYNIDYSSQEYDYEIIRVSDSTVIASNTNVPFNNNTGSDMDTIDIISQTTGSGDSVDVFIDDLRVVE